MAILLAEFDIIYVMQKAINGQTVVNDLATTPSRWLEAIDKSLSIHNYHGHRHEKEYPFWPMYFELYSKWCWCNAFSPKGAHCSVTVELQFPCRINIAEYEACIIGLQAAQEMNIWELKVYGDSIPIICQTTGQWKQKAWAAHIPEVFERYEWMLQNHVVQPYDENPNPVRRCLG